MSETARGNRSSSHLGGWWREIGVLGVALIISLIAAWLVWAPGGGTGYGMAPAAVDVPAVSISYVDPVPRLPTPDAGVLSRLLGLPPMFEEYERTLHRESGPFTIAPPRPRDGVIRYTVQEGDTVFSIAERFGLSPDSIFWANREELQHDVHMLRVGVELNILPVDGVYHTVVGSQTVQEIADMYGVDPYDIIDSEFNDLQDASPDTELEDGMRIVVPGGVSDYADWTWNPVVHVSSSSAPAPSTSGEAGEAPPPPPPNTINFAPGEPGNCGPIPFGRSGTGAFQLPVDSYRITQGFYPWHPGVDLAGEEGMPVRAADNGVVIYAGWSTWGYGNFRVLSHTPAWTSYYAHLSAIYVGCGQ